MYEILALIALLALIFELVFISYLIFHMITIVNKINHTMEYRCDIMNTTVKDRKNTL